MLWWFEWIDQGARFDPYSAVTKFMAGEDLRAPAGQTPGQMLVIEASDTGPTKAKLWCHAWSRSGRLLGYLLDEEWQQDGREVPVRAHTSLHIGDQIKPGPMTLSWWDADNGHELKRHRFTHPGGELNLAAPPWRKHVAFKLWRDEPAEN